MKNRHSIVTIILIIALLVSNFSTVSAVPPMPSSFYGTVTVNGENVPDGTTVTAWINGMQYATTTTETYEGVSVYGIDVKGDDLETAEVEGGVLNDTVVFHIGIRTAAQTGTWVPGSNVELNLSADLPTYLISGNAGVEGVTLTYELDGTKTATSDSSGNYEIIVPQGWSGTITPSKDGYTFNPVNAEFTNVTTNHSGTDFTATLLTYSISGKTSIKKVTLSYVLDDVTQTVISDNQGDYEIIVPYGWSGTLTPNLTGYHFSPDSVSFTEVTADHTNVDFTAILNTYTISGNAGTANATVTYVVDGGTITDISDSNGDYEAVVPYRWEGTITPSKAGYTFTPTSLAFESVDADITNANFTATINTYTISGNTDTGGVTLTYVLNSVTETVVSDGSGNYAITVPHGWGGVITPSKEGFTFAPTAITFENVISNQTNADFDAVLITYTISGNTETGGVTLTYVVDSVTQTVSSDGSGNYSITVPYNWSGSVTPSKAGYTFSPLNRTFTDVTANQVNADFAATLNTYTISGNTEIDGVTLTYIMDSTTLTEISDGSGDYSITVPHGWSGSITPSKTGYHFTPTSLSFTNVTSNQTNADFLAALNIYTITGNTETSGVTLNYVVNSVTESVISDGNGDFSITVTHGWSGTITPSKVGYTFSPTSIPFENVTSNQLNADFDATMITYTISGNTQLEAVTLTYLVDSTTMTDISDGSGNYSITVPYGWSGTITPGKTGYHFTPTSLSFTNVIANQTNADFTATLNTYTISGNTGTGAVTLTYVLNSETETITSDGSGDYSITVPHGWSGTLTPSKAGYTFIPASLLFDHITADQGSADFLATLNTYTISGNTGTGAVTLTYVLNSVTQTVTSAGSGDYSITVPYGWSGSVTPSKTGYTFIPSSLEFVSVTANQTGADFAATLNTYTISGNTGTAAVTLTYELNSVTETEVSDGSGNYSITVPHGWSGSITPGKAGYTFTPNSLSFVNVASNQINEDFAATLNTYTISGNTGTGGVTLTYVLNSVTKTEVSDGSGDYSITVPYGWSGSITPGKAGYTFTPTSLSFVNVTSNQIDEDFTATINTYTISGNTGTGGVTVTYVLNSETETTTSDGGGNYSITVPYGWSGSITPVKTGYTFTPSSLSFVNVTSNQTGEDFTAILNTYTISGNTGTGGVTLTYVVNSETETITSDGSGNYSITVPYGWSGSITPVKTGYTFTPANLSFTNVTASQTGSDFTATLNTYTISGNTGTGGVTLTYVLNSETETITSDGSGNYSFTVPYGWSGTLTPQKVGYTFAPESLAISNVTSHKTEQDFTATLITFSISGNTSISAVTLAYSIDSVPKTATSDGSGNYSITVPYGWSGTITPASAGYSFSPTQLTFTDVVENHTEANFFAAAVTLSITGNAGVAGATVSYTINSIPLSTTADASGNFEIPVSYGWSGTITPTKTGYTFEPVNWSLTNVVSNRTGINFTATQITYTISGNTGIGEATLNYVVNSATETETSDSSGDYSITVPYGWSGTLTPTKEAYSFTPSSLSFTNVLANQNEADFTAILLSYMISGNAGTSGVSLSYTDGTPKTATSSASGFYSFVVSYNWSGVVIPAKEGYVFSPTSRTYSSTQADNDGENYSATILTFELSIAKDGTGTGSVTSNIGGIDCGSTCSDTYDYGTEVTLTAVPEAGGYHRFIGWSGGGCSGTGTCTVALTEGINVTASFEEATFADVPFTHPRWAYIEALWNSGLTKGCTTSGPLGYCPEQTMFREESAVFVLQATFDGAYTPPTPLGTVFVDMTDPSYWSTKWAEGMLEEGLTAGCQYPPTDPLKFCPWGQFTREQGSVFGLNMKHGAGYAPPPATGTVFADMTDPGYWGTKWAEQAYAEGLLEACGMDGGKPLFCPGAQLDRSWSAFIIVNAKELTLPD